MCVCERERERVCVRERERVLVYLRERVCERERESVCERESLREREHLPMGASEEQAAHPPTTPNALHSPVAERAQARRPGILGQG